MIALGALLVVLLAIAWGVAIWRLLIPPANQLVRIVSDLTPILIDLRQTFTGVGNPFAVLSDATEQIARTISRLEAASDDAADQAAAVKDDLERTQHAAAAAGEASRTRSKEGRAEDAAANAAAAGSAAVGAVEPPA